MDLAFLSGNFLYDDSLPVEKRWLYKYFKSPEQRRFITYFYFFSSLHEKASYRFYRAFRDHTGLASSRRVLQKWIKQFKEITKEETEAKNSCDLDKLFLIKSGRFWRGRYANIKPKEKSDSSSFIIRRTLYW